MVNMRPKLSCVVDNQTKKFMKNGLLHREDGPALISGDVREYWFDGCLVSAAMLELHKTLTPEIDEIIKNRKVVQLEAKWQK